MTPPVRIALLHKSDGGMRPLAVASVVYRVCMSATCQALRSWAPPELHGGIPTRGMEGVHALIFGDREDQLTTGALAGFKADVQRCERHRAPQSMTAPEVLLCLGASLVLCGLCAKAVLSEALVMLGGALWCSVVLCGAL